MRCEKFEPGFGEKHQLYVVICSFLGTVGRTSAEQSDRNIFGLA